MPRLLRLTDKSAESSSEIVACQYRNGVVKGGKLCKRCVQYGVKEEQKRNGNRYESQRMRETIMIVLGASRSGSNRSRPKVRGVTGNTIIGKGAREVFGKAHGRMTEARGKEPDPTRPGRL